MGTPTFEHLGHCCSADPNVKDIFQREHREMLARIGCVVISLCENSIVYLRNAAR